MCDLKRLFPCIPQCVPPLGRNFFYCERWFAELLPMTHPDRFHAQTCCSRPGRGPDKVGVPEESSVWVPTCYCLFPCSSGLAQVGPWWDDVLCDGLGVTQKGIAWSSPPAIVFLSFFVVWKSALSLDLTVPWQIKWVNTKGMEQHQTIRQWGGWEEKWEHGENSRKKFTKSRSAHESVITKISWKNRKSRKLFQWVFRKMRDAVMLTIHTQDEPAFPAEMSAETNKSWRFCFHHCSCASPHLLLRALSAVTSTEPTGNKPDVLMLGLSITELISYSGTAEFHDCCTWPSVTVGLPMLSQCLGIAVTVTLQAALLSPVVQVWNT